jgi:Eukaryotic DNA topoisomerase I, catalytic core
MIYTSQIDRIANHVLAFNIPLDTKPETNKSTLFNPAFIKLYNGYLKLAVLSGIMGVYQGKYRLESSVSVLAVTTNTFVGAFKYFAYLSYVLEFQKTPNFPVNTIILWQQDAVNSFSPFKVNLARPFTKITRLLNKPNFKLTDEAYEVLFDQTKIIRDILNKQKPKIVADQGMTANLRTFLANIFTYFNSKSVASFKSITNNVRFLNDPKLSALLHQSTTTIDVEPVKRYLAFVRRKSGRKDAQYFTKDEKDALSERDLNADKQLRKDAATANKARVQALVRDSGKMTIPAQDAKKQLADEGFVHWQIPKGFTGHIDETGKLHTHTGLPLATGQVGGVVKMNPNWNAKTDNTYYAKGKGELAKGGGHIYTENYTKNKRGAKKGDDTADLESRLDGMQKEWRKDLTKGQGDDKLLGAMLEAMYQTSSRIGGDNNKTDGEKTYGLTTWLSKHVKVNAGGSLVITYKGKKGMTQRHVIQPNDPVRTALIKYMAKLKQGKGPNDELWTNDDGNVATAGNLRAYVKSMGYMGHVHALRHVKADRLWKEGIAQKRLKKNPTPKEVDNYHKALSMAVGKALGHKRTKVDPNTGKSFEENVGTTAQQSYISPGLQQDLYTKNGVPIPKWLEKIKQD